MKLEDHQLLKAGAHAYGVVLSEEQLRLFGLFLEELWSWNRRMNLTGISGKREIIIKLLLDSLVALPHLSTGGTVLDVGSGAGIPGLPLKIARPEFQVHLLEVASKKVSFLKNIIRKLGLSGIEAYRGRADSRFPVPTLFKGYDIVTARALAPLKKTIGICFPYLGPGGLMLTFKGSRINQEIEDSHKFMSELHLNITKKIAYRLPETAGTRYLLIVKKEEINL